MTRSQYVQWIAAAGLFGVWVALVWFQVKGAEELISCIKAGLGAFGLYCWNERATSKGADIANQSANQAAAAVSSASTAPVSVTTGSGSDADPVYSDRATPFRQPPQ